MRVPRRGSLLVTVVAVAALMGGVLTPGSDAAAPSTERLSVSDGEAQANAASANPSTSEKGDLVAFDSGASNLVAGDSNASVDVFVRNRSGTTQRVSVATSGAQGNGDSADPSLSPDGRFVGFSSVATNLVSGDSNAASDVFLRDRESANTERVSVTDGGGQTTGGSSVRPSVSRNGTVVAFDSDAPNLGNIGGSRGVFVRDRAAGSTEHLSVSPGGDVFPGGDSRNTAVTPDGRFVAFDSTVPDLVNADGNSARDVFIHDRAEDTTERVSVSSGEGEANARSRLAAVSADGRYVAFASNASNLVSGDSNSAEDIFVRDRAAGTTQRVSVSSSGAQANAGSTVPSISADGRFVAFHSAANNLVSGDTNGEVDVFVHDRLTATTERVSVGSQGNARSRDASVAGLLPFVGFESAASNLVSGDTNGVQDVFLRQYLAQTGYYILDDVGGIFTFGDATFKGSVPGLRNSGVMIGQSESIDLAVTPSGRGYFVLDEFGGIFTFGDATFKGSLPGRRASGVEVGDAPAIDISVSSSGNGYYILDAEGGVHTFGDAKFKGSIPGLREEGVEIGPSEGVDLAALPNGEGYYILDNVGGIFGFGDAMYFGSVPGLRNSGIAIGQAPAIRLEVTSSGQGYMVLDSVGGIFTFGDSRFHGSIPGLRNAGVAIGPAFGVDIAMTPASGGYLILDNQGGIFTFGDGTFLGSVPALREAGVSIGPADSIRLDIVAGLVGG